MCVHAICPFSLWKSVTWSTIVTGRAIWQLDFDLLAAFVVVCFFLWLPCYHRLLFIESNSQRLNKTVQSKRRNILMPVNLNVITYGTCCMLIDAFVSCGCVVRCHAVAELSLLDLLSCLAFCTMEGPQGLIPTTISCFSCNSVCVE